MKFKLIIALVDTKETDTVLSCAREAGATGSTVITSARGEGLKPPKSFFGLDLTGQRDMVLLIVEQHLSGDIMRHMAKTCEFDETSGTGIAFQIDIEDAVGLTSQIGTMASEAAAKE